MNITQRVENILRVSRDARNSDTELLIIYMQKSGMELTDRQIAKFRDLPSMETIRRVRQKIQEHGKYPADDSVNEARFRKFKQVKQNITYDDPEKLLEARGYRIVEDR